MKSANIELRQQQTLHTINAFELLVYRRVLRVSYQDRVSNVRIFEMVHEKPKLLLTVREKVEVF